MAYVLSAQKNSILSTIKRNETKGLQNFIVIHNQISCMKIDAAVEFIKIIADSYIGQPDKHLNKGGVMNIFIEYCTS